MSGWIGVDLDRTLAKYSGWQGIEHIGEPIPQMVERIKWWLTKGQEVKIFTARVSVPEPEKSQVVAIIQDWLEKQGLPRLEVTNVKDFGTVEIWDDIAVGVIPNTGIPLRKP